MPHPLYYKSPVPLTRPCDSLKDIPHIANCKASQGLVSDMETLQHLGASNAFKALQCMGRHVKHLANC